MSQPLPRGVWSYSALRTFAESQLAACHPSMVLPIPIEEIIELHFRLDVVPLNDLYSHGVDAFVSGDLTTIYVDNGIYNHPSPHRLRFSLAHELAHVLLHREILEAITYTDVAGWRSFLDSLDDDDLNWLEWQAYSLAGLLLVPTAPLERAFDEVATRIQQAGHDIRHLGPRGYSYIAKILGDQYFRVSSAVIDKRATKESLWGAEDVAG